MVNTTGRIFSKTGVAQQTFNLNSFFGVPTGYRNFDPKVIFDSTSSRFFATYVSYCDNATLYCLTDTGVLHIAVSTSSDPVTQPWKLYIVTLTNDFPDYPGIGLTDDKFTVSYNRFDIDGPPGAISPGCTASGYCGVQVLAVQKSDLVAGVTSPAAFFSAADLSHFSIRPAHSLSSTSTQYMASVTSGSSSIIHLWQVTGTPAVGNTALTEVAHTAIATLTSACVRQTAQPACAEQLGTAFLIDSGDNRALEAIWRDGSMWVAATGTCNWPGDTATRSCLKLVEVNTTDNTVLQDYMFGAFGAYYYYPAIRTDASNNLHVVYTRSSSSEYAHVRVAGRLSTDAPNTMSGDTLVKAGEISYLPGIGSSPYRWGDYSGTALDPSDPSIVWVAGTYAKDDGAQRWGTWIGKLQYGGTPTPTPSPTPTPTASPAEPDLTVLSISTNPLSPSVGEATEVTITVTNVGDAAAGHFYLDFYEHRPTPPGAGEIGDFSCEWQSLNAGSTGTCTHPSYAFASAGTLQMWAQIDTDQEVTESNEANNVFGPQPVTVTAPTASPTPTPTPSPTPTPTASPAPTPTPTATPTPTPTPTPIASSTPTATVLGATATPSPTAAPDTDGDGIPDSTDNCPNWYNPLQNFPPWPVPTNDPDCDGFSTTTLGGPPASEAFLGTDPYDKCADTPIPFDERGPEFGEPLSPWPPDIDDDGKTTMFDALAFSPAFNTISGVDPNYSARYDLNGDGKVTLLDVLSITPFFNLFCDA